MVVLFNSTTICQPLLWQDMLVKQKNIHSRNYRNIYFTVIICTILYDYKNKVYQHCITICSLFIIYLLDYTFNKIYLYLHVKFTLNIVCILMN